MFGIVVAMLLSSCSTLMTGTGPQDVTLKTQPEGARMVVKDKLGNIVFEGLAPATIKLGRDVHYVDVTLEGYRPIKFEVKTNSNWSWGNLGFSAPGLILGPITASSATYALSLVGLGGIVVDALSGSWSSHSKEHTIVLTAITAGSTGVPQLNLGNL